MLSQRDQFPQFFHLQQFAFDHLLGQLNQNIQHPEIPLLHRNLERLHVEPVARQNALRISPLSVGGGAPTTGLSLINDVIVHQGGGVNDLHHRSQADGSASLVIE